MSAAGELLVGLVMVIGLVGVVVPVLPGLFLVWAAGVAWAWLDGGGAVRWTVAAVLTALLVAGTALKYVLPARRATAAGAPRSTLLLGAFGAIVGFFVLPFLGFAIGGVGVVFLVELSRLGSAAAAWGSTRAVLVGIGVGMLVELSAAALMLAVWLAAVLLT
jgi:uncharacterized protein YqgC (DUF456 family)